MKINKTITIDIELIELLEKDKGDVSEICNKALWNHIKKQK